MKKLIALLLALVMVLSLAACGAKEEAAEEETKEEAASEEKTEEATEEKAEEAEESEEAAAEEGEAKDTLVFQIASEPTNLDLQNDGTIRVGFICDQIYGKLVTFNENSEVVGELAESWEWTKDDFTQLTFKIREDAKFSDGTDITADDFIYTFSTDSAKANIYLSCIAGMEAPDAKTLVMDLTAPNSSMLKYLTTYHCGVVPAGCWDEMEQSKGATAYSGPYMVAKWEMGQDFVLEANPHWYDFDNIAIKTVDYDYISDENSALVALESGEIDVMFMDATIGITSLETIETIDTLKALTADQATAGMLCLNFASMPELDDVNVRLAMSAAIDRAAVAKVSTTGVPASNVFTTEFFGDDYIPGHDAPAQDLEKAKEYLAASNYPDGFTVELIAVPMFSKAAAVIQANLAEIGIEVVIKEIDTSIWVDTMIKGDYQMGFMTYGNLISDLVGFVGLYNPDASLHFNFDDDPTCYDYLMEALTVSGADRTAVLTEFADYCEEYVPYIGLFMENPIQGFNADLNVPVSTGCGYDLAGMSW